MQQIIDGVLEGIGGGLIAALFPLVVLPMIYALVGANKRERRDRAAEALRLDADIARGLADLSQSAADDAMKARLRAMHDVAMADFVQKAQAHFDLQKSVEAAPEKQYVLLPPPRGFFGLVWSFFAILWVFILTLLVVLVAIGVVVNPPPGDTLVSLVFGMALLLGIGVGLTMLFRRFAFMSARRAARRARG